MQNNEVFSKEIAPFFWTEHENSVSVCLVVGEYLQDVFDSRADEGFEGGGYDWESLARVFLEEKLPDLIDRVEFDSEAGMFCAFSKDPESLQSFILEFKKACENRVIIMDLFSRAELD